MPDLTNFVYFLLAIVIAIDVHEFFHAWMADKLGDPTARLQGRLTLNPLAHLDPMGSILILFSSLAGRGLGWGKPVPVNPNNLRNGPIVGEALVAFGGPLSNILTASIVAVPLRLAGDALPSPLAYFLLVLFFVSISLAVFNLLPIFPLDGYHFWLGILHELPFPATRRLWWSLNGGAFQTYGPVLLLVLVFWGQGILGGIIRPVMRFFSTLLLGQAIL